MAPPFTEHQHWVRESDMLGVSTGKYYYSVCTCVSWRLVEMEDIKMSKVICFIREAVSRVILAFNAGHIIQTKNLYMEMYT